MMASQVCFEAAWCAYWLAPFELKCDDLSSAERQRPAQPSAAELNKQRAQQAASRPPPQRDTRVRFEDAAQSSAGSCHRVLFLRPGITVCLLLVRG